MRAGRTKEVLFQEEVDGLGGPLFENAYDLARRLVEYEIREDEGRERTRRWGAHLAQILTYNNRPCPDRIRQEISAATSRRILDAGLQPAAVDDWSSRVKLALEADHLARSTLEPMSADALFQDLLERAEVASEQFVMTHQPAEVRLGRRDHKRAESLHEILLRRTGLKDLAAGRELGEATTKYVFTFPGPDVAEAWWWALFSHVCSMRQQSAGDDDPAPRVHGALQALNEGRVLVAQYVERPFRAICVHPTVVLDPLSPSASGYTLYYSEQQDTSDDGGLVSVAQMNRATLMLWKTLVHRPLLTGEIKVEPVLYEGPK